MAKRKRLTPAVGLETKAYKDGWAGTQARSGGSMGPPTASPAPMAPIAEVAGSAATAAALDELAHEIHDARASGRLVITTDLAAIDARHLVRDRAELDPEDMDALKASLVARGQQTPIDVVDLGSGSYGLISGWRRLTALTALNEDHPGAGFDKIQCLIRNPDTSAEAYVAMVEENEIRAPLSHYERARIAARASEQGAFDTPRKAARALFGSVPRAKRSKIYSFLEVYNTLDDVLTFGRHLSEREGLAISKALGREDGALICNALRSALKDEAPQTANEERALLARVLKAAQEDGADLLRDDADEDQGKLDPDPIVLNRRGQSLTLRGAGVDDALEADLRAWLASRV